MAVEVLLQTPGTPVVFEALSRLVSSNAYQRLRIAVAFATLPGVQLLQRLLTDHDSQMRIEIVIGLDRSMTEPRALRALLEDGRFDPKVFRSPSGTMLHTKAYVFDGPDDGAILIGSCNLSAAALTRNREAALLVTAEIGAASLSKWEDWWTTLWPLASPLNESLIEQYESGYDPTTGIPADSQISAAPEPVSVSAQGSERLWLGTGMTGAAGTQLELPQRAAAFFVDPADIGVVLDLTLTRGSQTWPGNRLAFYENDMWRINLSGDIPEVAEKALPHKYVLFQRTSSENTFVFEVVGEDEVDELRAASQTLDQYDQTPTRDFGWL